jgi:hypothetical protein
LADEIDLKHGICNPVLFLCAVLFGSPIARKNPTKTMQYKKRKVCTPCVFIFFWEKYRQVSTFFAKRHSILLTSDKKNDIVYKV